MKKLMASILLGVLLTSQVVYAGVIIFKPGEGSMIWNKIVNNLELYSGKTIRFQCQVGNFMSGGNDPTIGKYQCFHAHLLDKKGIKTESMVLYSYKKTKFNITNEFNEVVEVTGKVIGFADIPSNPSIEVLVMVEKTLGNHKTIYGW